MQATAQHLREQLWAKLQVIYDKYADKAAGQIMTSKVEQIVHDALGQQTQQQIDYVVKNMFRLDADSNGSVSFLQFANFLFQRHCGQMSLQRMHLLNKMSHGSQRKMTQVQFHTLMNNAYKFLGVECPQQVTNAIFVQADKDKDSLITYVEYFQIINKYICKKTLNEPKAQEPAPQGKERISRLRVHLWKNLRALYEAYVSGRNLSATDKELRSLLSAIVGDLSQNELVFILTQLFKLDFKSLEFNQFAIHFFYLMAQLGLSRFSKNQVSSKKTLNKQEFVVVFKNTFKFLSVSKIKDQFLWLHFAKIDKNHDGFISYDQYLDWIRRFIAVLNYYGDQFYVPQDDLEIQGYDMFPIELKPTQPKKTTLNNFVFSDLSLAYQVRQRCFFLLERYDVNKDKLFDQTQIQAALTDLLKENQYQLAYVTRNVFRYDRDGDKNVTYDQLTNFCVQQHFGQMAIQRLHKKNSYTRGKERIMNQEEFAATLKYALSFIEVNPSDQILKLLFKEIDLDHDGWISYEVYFLFLRYYFGSLSEAAQKKEEVQVKLTKDEQFLLSLKDLSALDRFVRILLDQLRIICGQFDYNKNHVYEVDQIQAILGHVFKLDENQTSYVLYSYFRFSSRKDKFVTYEEMIAIILEIYFIQILFKRRYKDQNSEVWKTKLISLDEFIILITEACFFIRVKPPKQDLKTIFIILDTNKDGFISFQQYINFIRQYLGRGLNIVDESQKKKQETASKIPGISEEQLAFIQALWGELKKYFDQYDKGTKGFINEQQLKAFSIQVLRQTTKRELDYIFWNLFRVDSNSNRQVDFEEFAPFILSHAGQISLQRYHKEQVKGKSSLNEDELFIVLGNAYNFLSTMPKSRGIVSIIYGRISQNGTCSYGNFLGWINNALCKKFR